LSSPVPRFLRRIIVSNKDVNRLALFVPPDSCECGYQKNVDASTASTQFRHEREQTGRESRKQEGQAETEPPNYLLRRWRGE
jgi:hypothetical protein